MSREGLGHKGPQSADGPIGPRSASPNGVDGLDLLIATSVIPDEPNDGALYMDDGTNRQDGAIGLIL